MDFMFTRNLAAWNKLIFVFEFMLKVQQVAFTSYQSFLIKSIRILGLSIFNVITLT